MAIFHYSAKIIGRSSGRSAVGASAYRSGERLFNERDGMAHDYRNKSGIEYTEILAPEKSPEWVYDREKLWNIVEKSEIRKDSQLAREINLALPAELDLQQQINLVKKYAQDNFISRGMVADIAIHDKKDGNPHAHIMLTTRDLTPEGDGFGKKNREWNPDFACGRVVGSEKYVDWREAWAKSLNDEFQRLGIPERVDHRSYKDQGIDKVPTKHEGQAVRAMEQRGIETEIGTHNREVKEQNKMMKLIEKQIGSLEKQRGILEHDRASDHGNRNKDHGTGNGADDLKERGKPRRQDHSKDQGIEPSIEGGTGEQSFERIISSINREIQGIEKRAGRYVAKNRGDDKSPSGDDHKAREQQRNGKDRSRGRGFDFEC